MLLGAGGMASRAQEERIEFTAPLVVVKAKDLQEQAAGEKKKADAQNEDATKNAFPVRFGMSSSEVVAELGRPTGHVTFSNKLTFFLQRWRSGICRRSG